MISVDIGIVHVGVGMNTPLLAIYPDMDEFNPWLPPASPRVRIVHVQQDREQYRITGMKNMNSFADEEVLHGLQELLAATA